MLEGTVKAPLFFGCRAVVSVVGRYRRLNGAGLVELVFTGVGSLLYVY